MKIVTSVTVWNDAVGKRLSMTYSEVDESGRIITDNKRVDRVVTDPETAALIASLQEKAQAIVG